MVSVIIPTYNRARTILPAIDSVLQQTYKNLELWVIDDGSTDDTPQAMKAIKDPRFHYFRFEKNVGSCAARNKGVELAHGDYIAYQDSDDKWHLDKLEKQMAFLLRTQSDIVACGVIVHDEKGNFLHNFPNNYNEERIVTYTDLLCYNSCSTQTFLGKKSCFENVPSDPTMPRLTDWDQMLRFTQRYKVSFEPALLVDSFVQKDSITKHPERGVIAMDKLFEKHHDAIVSHPKIAESFFRKKAAFVCQTGKNPTAEFKALRTYAPSFANTAKYLLARTGLYLPLFNHRH